MTWTAIIAQDAAPAKAAQMPFFANPLFLIAMFGLFFLVVMLPAQRRQKREQAAMLANLKAGTKVQLASGILGTIVKAKDGEEDMVIRSEDSKFKVLRSTVVRVLGEESSES